MSAASLPTPSLPWTTRVPPGAWIALASCAATAYSLLTLVHLPGEGGRFRGWDLPNGNRDDLIVASVLPLLASLLLRRGPLRALALLILGAVFDAMALNSSEINFAQFLPVTVAVFLIAASSPRRTAVAAGALTLGSLAVFVVVRLICAFNIGTSTELAVALTAAVAWLIGNSVHQARGHGERMRAQAAERAVTEERLRIARELHDMVAHSIGIIALQSGAASRVIETQPDRARAALREVERTSRETLSGLRRMLGALRTADTEGASPVHPPSGLADLDRLAATTTAAGVRVELRRVGRPRPLPPEIDLAAYRIVQESVTNVVRHAGTGRCRVTVAFAPEELSVEVVDPGGPATGTGPGRRVPRAEAGTGYGLVGMGERVALLHGEFTAAPRPEGGFRVAARLPLPALPAEAAA